MTKTKQHRPAGKPESKAVHVGEMAWPQATKKFRRAAKIISVSELLRAKRNAIREGLPLEILIPGEVLPLFRALATIMGLDLPAFAVWAICKGCTSEAAMEQFDRLVNDLL